MRFSITLPGLHDLSPDNPYVPIYRQIGEFLESIDVPFINPLEAVGAAVADSRKSPWVAPDDPHPSAAIHAILAAELAAAMGPIFADEN